jgi:hypothetical protein
MAKPLTRAESQRIARSIASSVLDMLVFVFAMALALAARDCTPLSTSINAVPVEEMP